MILNYNILVLLYFIYIAVNFCACENVNQGDRNRKKNPLVDSLIDSLENGKWEDDSKQCIWETLDILYGVRNRTLWATKVWDSMQHPAGVTTGVAHHFGYYDQCVYSEWSRGMQYCLVDVRSVEKRPNEKLDEVDSYLKTITEIGRPLDRLTVGVCVPSSCRPNTVGEIYRHMYGSAHLLRAEDVMVTVNPRDCQLASKQYQYPTSYYAFWLTMASLVTFVLIATLYINCFDDKNKFLESIAKPFCMVTNWNGILRVSKNEIKIINTMRFLNAIIGIMAHGFFFKVMAHLNNPFYVDEEMQSSHGKMLQHCDIFVNTFFMTSALLLTRSLLGGSSNLLLNLIKRYVRLIGPLTVVSLYLAYVAIHTGDGPNWSRLVREETDICEDYWWRNLLMINNKVEIMCYSVAWYVSVDFQLKALGIFIFLIFKRNRRFEKTICVALAAMFSFKLAYIVYTEGLSIIPFDNPMVFIDLRSKTIINEIYLAVHVHAGSFFVGMVMGYIVWKYKPHDYRNVINQKWSLVGLLASLTLMGLMSCINYVTSIVECNQLVIAALAVLNRAVWAVAVCGVIGVFEYGNIKYVRDVWASDIFSPLAKLTYCIYLTHTLIIQKHLYSSRVNLEYNYFAMLIHFLGTVVATLVVSLALCLIVEAPLSNLANILFNDKIITPTKTSLKKSDVDIEKKNIHNSSKSKLL